MAKESLPFEVFLADVHPAHVEYVENLHQQLLGQGCAYRIETAKSGFVLSYVLIQTQKVIANYVFRKSGLIIRIYGDHIARYPEILETLPQGMVKAVEKSSVCRRLLDPTKCNARCPMGYVFDLGGVTHKKCRYSGFMFPVTDENYQAIRDFLQQELEARAAA